MEGTCVNLFEITIIAAVICLVIGVVAIVRGRGLAGFLAVLLAIGIAAFGYREEILAPDANEPPPVTVTAVATPEP